MLYKTDWEQTKGRWEQYWRQSNPGTPLMYLIGEKPGAVPLPEVLKAKSVDDQYRNAARKVASFRHYCQNHVFLMDSFPNLSLDFGPGSLAGYLGCEIVFKPDTVWFEPFVKDWAAIPDFRFDPDNVWWKEHYRLLSDAKALAGDDFYVDIPDLMENMDVLASMRGAQELIFDMMDEPEEVDRRIRQIEDVYFEYYDRFYELVRSRQDHGSCYTVFQIWGEGRIAKLQCDFSALLSPQQFRQFIQGSLRRQTARLDRVLYHLDGPDAIKHVDALMEIKEIDALQWTSGDHGPDGTLPEWDVIYDKVRKAGKSLWIRVYTGEYDDWVRGAERIVKKYGSRGLFLMFPHMPLEQARNLERYAVRNWSDVAGTLKWQ